MNIKEVIKRPEYKFLYEHQQLRGRIILLTLGGSYAYGVNTAASDIDLRGCALPSQSDLLGLTSFEQYLDAATDTTIYAWPKLVRLLLNCNPNCIEMLGCKPEHYAMVAPAGQMLLDNAKLFLSQRAIVSFGGYANQQLNRLLNAIARDRLPQAEQEEHIWRSCQSAMLHFNERYAAIPEGALRLYVDRSGKNGLEQEIFLEASLSHYPLRDFSSILNDWYAIIRDYGKLNHRNSKKDLPHLAKHMMHLIRLYMMVLDILEKEQIVTCREAERDLLLAIRKGEYLTPAGQCTDEFTQLLADYQQRFTYASRHTNLPPKPDWQQINELTVEINKLALE